MLDISMIVQTRREELDMAMKRLQKRSERRSQ